MAVTLESLKKSIGKKNSSTTRAFAWLADLECEAGNLDAALQRVDGGLTLYPSDVSAMLVRAKILFRLEGYDACIQECEQILQADPFNLAAQRIMGDSYDKVGNETERNRCYRRVHDMDPLNTFWKDEFDVVVESAAVAGVVATDEFTLPEDDSLSMDQMSSVDESAAEVPAEPAPAEGAEDADSFEVPAEQDADNDDPFASLAAMMPNGDSVDESAIDDLSASLASVMDDIESTPSVAESVEEFGAEENISGNDVNSALSDMFGLDDDLEPEEAVPAARSVFSETSIPASIDEAAEEGTDQGFEKSAEFNAAEASVEDKPQSVDSAFDSIFGEDELPEEKDSGFEKSAEFNATEASTDDKPQSVDSAFDSIFGEDELPEEKDSGFEKSVELEPVEQTPAEDKPQSVDNAFDSIFGEDELPEEKDSGFEKSVELEPVEQTPAEDKPQSVDSAFDSIFGEDELPEEKETSPADVFGEKNLPSEEGGLFEKSAAEDLNLAGEWSPEPVKEETAPVEEAPTAAAEETAALDIPSSVDNAFDSIFGEDELPEEKTAEEVAESEVSEAPVEESLTEKLEETSEPAAEAESAAETDSVNLDVTDSVESTVDSAFGALFGEDELPDENNTEEKPAESEVADEPAASLVEQVDQAETELELPEVKDESSDIAKEMGGAFASMFGDDDDLDLPSANASAAEPPVDNDQEVTGAAIEENDDALIKERIEKDLDKSFDNLFGEEENLNLPETESAAAETNEKVEDQPASENADLDSLESEVSGAFKGLFDMDDDSLTEEEKPSNSGVDFLMSGDSDDEISAGLIDNPDAPLDRGAHDLDESLNTRTLAEIYFDQGLYGKALEIYKDLVQKEPENEEIVTRLGEIEKIYNEKFGGNA